MPKCISLFPSNLIVGLFFCSLLFLGSQSCMPSGNSIFQASEKNEWKKIKEDTSEKPAWIIYTRKLAGTNLLEYKIQGNIASSAEVSVASFKQSIYDNAFDAKNKKYLAFEIIKESDDSLLTYAIHKESFPFKDTEMRVRYLFFSNPDGSLGISWCEDWSNCPIEPSRRLNRVETFRGSWSFSPVSGRSCHATNSVQLDLCGMPLWLAEPMVIKFLKEGLEEIKEKALTGMCKYTINKNKIILHQECTGRPCEYFFCKI